MVKIKKKYNNRKPWLTPTLRDSIKKKNKLYIKMRIRPTLHNSILYKQYRNKLNKISISAEKAHLKELFLKNNDNIQKTWQILKQVINKQQMNRRNGTFKIKDKLSTNAIEICEHFNEFFINVGPTLSKNISLQDSGAYDLIERLEHTLYLFPTDIQELGTMIKNLNNSSARWNDISPSVLKYMALYITKPFVNLIKLSFQGRLFPDELIITRVIPLYKNDDPMIFSNNRPVSILTAISKIYEKIMYNRLVSFLSKWKLLYQYQFGFRQHHSKYMALMILMDKLISALKERKFVLGLF